MTGSRAVGVVGSAGSGTGTVGEIPIYKKLPGEHGEERKEYLFASNPHSPDSWIGERSGDGRGAGSKCHSWVNSNLTV